MSTKASRAITVALAACNATTPQPPSPELKEAKHSAVARDASAPDWVELDCAKLLTSYDIAAICNSTLNSATFVADRGEQAVIPPFDTNPPTRATCSRSMKLDHGGVLLHFAIVDYSTPEALARITATWAKSSPQSLRDGLYLHEVRQDWIRRDVDKGIGRLAVSVFETDQPGHAALCSSGQLIKVVHFIEGRIR